MPPPLPPSQTQSASKPSPLRWVFIALVVLVVGFLGFRIVQTVQYYRQNFGQSDPRAEALSQATKLIVGSNHGIAHGNTAEATSLAQQVSDQLKIVRNTMFTGGKPSSIDRQLITKGEFLVFCQLNQDSCAFLIHVPELSSYKSDAKDAVAELSFLAAMKVLKSKNMSGVKKLAIATRGNLFYDQVWIGRHEVDSDGKAPLEAVQKDTSMSVLPKNLLPFFDQVKVKRTDVKS